MTSCPGRMVPEPNLSGISAEVLIGADYILDRRSATRHRGRVLPATFPAIAEAIVPGTTACGRSTG